MGEASTRAKRSRPKQPIKRQSAKRANQREALEWMRQELRAQRVANDERAASLDELAEAVGVRSKVISKWVDEHHAFIAEWQTRQEQFLSDILDRAEQSATMPLDLIDDLRRDLEKLKAGMNAVFRPERPH